MGNGIVEIRARVSALIEAARHVLKKVIADTSDVRWLMERIAYTLTAHIDELSEHLRRLGGRVPPQNGDSNARPSTLRELYADLSMAHAQALSLETDARAQGYSSTAAMATRHREEIATLLGAIREHVPAAIKEETAQAQLTK